MPAVAVSPEPGTPPPARPAAAVDIRGVSKWYAQRRGLKATLLRPRNSVRQQVLSDVTLSVAEGEFFGVLGPNGAGKTTLFKILATLVEPDAGTARILGHDVAGEPDAVRRILAPVVADERSLDWRLDSWENLRLFAALHQLSRDESRHRIRELIAQVELEADADKPAGQLSSGLRQRLMLARALLANPRVLLLDEPTRSLDPLSARRFREFLRDDVVRKRGCTVLLATHTSEEALDYCERVAILHAGHVVAVGPARQLAASLGTARYRLVARRAAAPFLAALESAGSVARVVAPAADDDDGWCAFELDLPGGRDAGARLIASLSQSGLAIAALEPVAVSLATLIDRAASLAPPATRP